ncbi:hypothetical protein [Nocardia lasii]|uniref:Ribbon-helix-helix protein, CopG family n=1 Tax=Nocardia lasii TaxID=1616107 RepID=A0ABW1JPV6_9NOCA
MTSVRQDGEKRSSATSRKRAGKKPVPVKRESGAVLGRSRLAQVRLRSDEIEALEQVMRTLQLGSTSDALREGLRLLAREAAEIDAAEEIRAFYGQHAPLPDGVVEPSAAELAAADDMPW